MNKLKRTFLPVISILVLTTACQKDEDSPRQVEKQVAPATQPTVQQENPAQQETGQAPVAPVKEEPSAEVKALEEKLPASTAMDTVGGQLIAGYLADRISGEQVVAETFEDSSAVRPTLAEMSLAINQKREEGTYDDKSREKVLVLEGAMTQFLNERAKQDERLAALVEYGAAISLGVIGGVYSDEILNALQRAGQARVVQAPLNGIKNGVRTVYHQLKGSPAAISSWLSSRSSRVGQTEPVANVVEKSSNLYRRAIGYVNTRGAVDGEQVVFRNISRVLNSPEITQGYQVRRIAYSELQDLPAQTYRQTGIPGFQIHQPAATSDSLIARMLGRGGEYEYYRVEGQAIRTITKDGTEMVVPPGGMIGLLKARLEGWGHRTGNFVSTSGHEIKDGFKRSPLYRSVAESPRMQRLVRGTAVGAPIGLMTLLALRPIDPHYITLDQYVKDLREEGVDIDQYIHDQRKKAEVETGRE